MSRAWQGVNAALGMRYPSGVVTHKATLRNIFLRVKIKIS